MISVRKVLLVPLTALLVPALVACGGSPEKDKAGAQATVSASSSPSLSSSPSASGSGTPTEEPSDSGDGVVLHKDGFSVKLPAEATSQTQNVPTKAGNLSVTLYIAPDPTNGGTYVIAMTEYPAGAALSLDNAITGAAKNIRGTVQASRKSEYLGHPTRDAVITASAQGQDVTVFGRFVQVDRKLFQLQFVVQKRGLSKPPAGFTDVVNSVTFD